MVKGMHAFVKVFLFKAGLTHPERLGANERAAYLAPHPTWSSRTSLLVFPREIPSGSEGRVSDFLAEVEKGLSAFSAKPVFIAWAMKDIAFTPNLLDELWLKTFPHAQVLKLEDAGHYLQEDAHEKIVPALLNFLGK